MLSSFSNERTIPDFVIVNETIRKRVVVVFFFSGKILLKSDICAHHKRTG